MKATFLLIAIFMSSEVIPAQEIEVENLSEVLTQMITAEKRPRIPAVEYSLAVTPGHRTQPTSVKIKVDCNELAFENRAGKWVGRFLMSLRISGKTSTVGYVGGDYRIERTERDLLNSGTCAPLLITRNFVLDPGDYKADLVAKDVQSDNRRRKTLSFRVKSN